MAKKLSYALAAALFLGLLTLGVTDRTAAGLPAQLPLWLCLPFAGLLLCVALCPLLCPSWWEYSPLLPMQKSLAKVVSV